MDVLITGHSRGLGRGLCEHYLEQGHTVFGLSRNSLGGSCKTLHQTSCDLANLADIPKALDVLVAPRTVLDLVYLNAGVLGDIANITETPLDAITQVMDINVWANKIILDWLARTDKPPGQVILISSGSANSGNHGWGAYALSKAALNMLTKLYAHEFPHSHLCALAPGFVHTDMQDALKGVDTRKFPSVKRMHQALEAGTVPSAAAAARRIASCVPLLGARPTGSFVDLRDL
jgi:benzil reductase ((S)-benzoin forming)